MLDLGKIEYWVFQAERNKYTSEVLLNELLEILQRQKKETNLELSNKKLALVSSFILMAGYALENLLKAALIKKYIKEEGPIENVTFSKLKNEVWKSKSGHELKQMALELGINLSECELSFLEKAEIYVKWAGKYFFPQNNSDYEVVVEGKLGLNKAEANTFTALFNSIKNQFQLNDGIFSIHVERREIT